MCSTNWMVFWCDLKLATWLVCCFSDLLEGTPGQALVSHCICLWSHPIGITKSSVVGRCLCWAGSLLGVVMLLTEASCH